MDHKGWERIQELFHAAVNLPAAERAAFLQTATANDADLIAEVLAMLAEDADSASLLDRDVAKIASQILTPDPAALLPEKVGQYRVLDILGEGGMGTVYLAEHGDLGNRVAIKLLRDAWMSPARRDRFATEQRTLAHLNHPNIARLYDADALGDGTPWFAMEYVEGVPLTQYCREHRSSIAERLRLVRAVCEAVQYAHSHAVIHRDLKPSNLLVRSDGAVKLLDFGISKQLDAEDRTRTGLSLMTPVYAAPEQIRGEYVGVYTDVFSLGVTAFELLAGQLPFEPTDTTRESPKPSGLKGDLDVLCQTALHPAPERRYASMEAMIRDIDHYLAGEPLEARPDSWSYRAGKFIRRNGRAVAVSALVAVCIVGLVVFYTLRLRSARNVAIEEAAKTQRILRFTLNLFNGGDEAAGPANDLKVTALVDRGAAEAAALNGEPVAQADIYETLGEVCRKLGRLDRANSFLTSALEKRTAAFGANSAPVAESKVKLGLLRSDQAKFEEAERLVREGLAWDKRNLGANDAATAFATYALGKVLENRGSYDAAIGLLQDAVRMRSGAETADLADSLLELANSHFYSGHYVQSEALNQRVLKIHRRLLGPQHPLVAEDLINLGAIQQELGRYKEAEQYHRQALAINEAFYGKDHYKTASSLTLVARALSKENRYDEAEQLLTRSLSIQEAVFGKVHPNVASAINDLGTIALARHHFDEARADFERMADIYRAVYNGKHYLIGIALANQGSVYMAQQDYAHAEPLFRQALAMYAVTLPKDHLNVAITKIKLGRVLLRQNRLQEAERSTSEGYKILSKQANSSVTWLQSARDDLAAIAKRK